MIRQWIVPLILALALFGCKPTVDPVGGDLNPELAKTIVSLSPSTTEIVGGSGISGTLVGRTESCNYPPVVKNVPVVMSGTKPNFEKIASIHPDLIVLDSALYSDADTAKIKELGINTIVMDSSSIEGFRTFLIELGKATGIETRLSKYYDDFMIRVKGSKATFSKEEVKPSVMVMLGGEGRYYVLGKNTFLADVLNEMGTEFIGADSGEYTQVSVEQILKWNPDVIFMPSGDDQKMMSDPQLSQLGAVKDKAVIGVTGDYLLRSGYRMDRLVDAMEKQINLVLQRREGR